MAARCRQSFLDSELHQTLGPQAGAAVSCDALLRMHSASQAGCAKPRGMRHESALHLFSLMSTTVTLTSGALRAIMAMVGPPTSAEQSSE